MLSNIRLCDLLLHKNFTIRRLAQSIVKVLQSLGI
jgi:hypothetical protein